MNELTAGEYSVVYDEGYLQGYYGYEKDCPYNENTKRSEAWYNGYYWGCFRI